jgi:hypothetical protein
LANLIRLVYVSDALVPFSQHDLAVLLRKAQQNNAARGLTGLLLSAGDHFMQVLEGTAEAVAERLDVISADPRHTRVHRLLCEVTTDRLFGKWTMGLLNVDAAPSLDRRQFRQVVERSADPTIPTDRTQVHKLLQNFHAQMTVAKAA